MRVVVDKNNPCVTDAFRQFGEVRALTTAEITKETVHDVDILIVRSETKVTKDLLDGSAVKFVGSATIGTDHVDIEYLESTSRVFASAPGSNANSVADYVVAALLQFSQKRSFALRGRSIGVVGVGNVGSKVVRFAEALGMTVLQNDPPLARSTGHSHFLPLDSLMECDFLTIHVPLTRVGEDPTYHLFSRERILKMKKGAVLINTSRGSVADGNAIKEARNSGHLSGVILDVWEHEPLIDIELLRIADIGTPHIAGYSYDGKVAAVKMLYDAACRHFAQQPVWSPALNGTGSDRASIDVDQGGNEYEKKIHEIVCRSYNIEKDDMALRSIGSVSEQERRAYFRRLRAEYPVRREFFNTRVTGSPDQITDILYHLGFQKH